MVHIAHLSEVYSWTENWGETVSWFLFCRKTSERMLVENGFAVDSVLWTCWAFDCDEYLQNPHKCRRFNFIASKNILEFFSLNIKWIEFRQTDLIDTDSCCTAVNAFSKTEVTATLSQRTKFVNKNWSPYKAFDRCSEAQQKWSQCEWDIFSLF